MITTDHLLSGPRGRRLLLEYARVSDQIDDDAYDPDSFAAALFYASYHLDPGRGTSVTLFSSDGSDLEPAVISAEETAQRLADVKPADVTPELLRTVLINTVDTARYWQEPDGEDVLAATVPMMNELRRLAEAIVTSPHCAHWCDSLQPDDQLRVEWLDPQMDGELPAEKHSLASWKARMMEAEQTALREWPTDPTANWSGEWWSIPETTLPHSNRSTFDGLPAGLVYVEDSLGFEHATVRPFTVPDTARVFEIRRAADWAELCRRFPLEVTATKRYDWYRTTGRTGCWVMPDWSLVAEEYDGVHLTIAAWIASAGTAIPVDEMLSSVIAGWNPDETWWLNDIGSAGEPVRWDLVALPDYTRIWTRT